METLTPEQVVIEIDAEDFAVALASKTLPVGYMCLQRQDFCTGQLCAAMPH